MGSADDDTISGVDVEAATGELYGGVRKSFGEGTVRPYVGRGLSIIRAAIDVEGGDEEDDVAPALYLHGGVAFAITPTFGLGLDLRGLFGSDIELNGVEGDADHGQLAIFLGFSF